VIHTPDVDTLLGGLSPQEFLRNYWQKKPLLIRNAWPGLRTPITPEELAGLACEDNVHARLVQEHGDAGSWQVRYAPFSEGDFLELPASHWTLLVSDCEKHLPELCELIHPFRFIPDWRVDDLMISYAVDQGSVGPHVDQYDVFLLQLAGIRRWQISDQPLQQAECLPGLELAILKSFDPTESWDLTPGDLLYLPPGIPHHGVAQGTCLTASIGFRAPSATDLLHSFAAFLSDHQRHVTRYSDPELSLQAHPAEITRASQLAFRSFLQQSLQLEPSLFQRWLGESLTESAHDEELLPGELDEKGFFKALNKGGELHRSSYARLAYMDNGETLFLFANGGSHELPTDYREQIIRLCETGSLLMPIATETSEKWRSCLYQLYLQGVLELG
jgi:50S ribosomal protein L16 3-hydroxylase